MAALALTVKHQGVDRFTATDSHWRVNGVLFPQTRGFEIAAWRQGRQQEAVISCIDFIGHKAAIGARGAVEDTNREGKNPRESKNVSG